MRAGMFFVAEVDGEPAGIIRFQLADGCSGRIFRKESAFVHRLVVRRRFKGQGVSTALLRWAVEHARQSGRSWLRLDCDASRSKLRALYEAFGFRLHSFRQVTSILRVCSTHER